MGEHRPVLLLTVGKAIHPAHVEFQLLKVRVQPVAAYLFFVEITVRAVDNGLHLFLRGGAAHNGKYLPGEHHADTLFCYAFQRPPVVIVIAVEPAVFTVRNPLLTPDVVRQPVRLLRQILGQAGQRNPDLPAADAVPALGGIPGQKLLFFRNAVIAADGQLQQNGQLFRKLRHPAGVLPLQQAKQVRQVPEIPRVGAGKGHALPTFRSHVQSVVPVGSTQAEDVVLSHLIESGEVLNQQVFQDTAGVNLAGGRPLSIAICRVPLSVDLCAPHGLRVLEIGCLRPQDIQVTRLVDIELGGHQGPECVVHPDPGNAVPVRDKVPQALSNDRSIRSVNPHAAEIGPDHFPYAVRVHQQKRQAVLPKVPPATSAPPVVVMGQERTAVNPPQEGLKAHPAHQAVEILRARPVANVDLVLPVNLCSLQRRLNLVRCAVGRQNPVYVPGVFRNAQENEIDRRFSRSQGGLGETDTAHSLSAVDFRARRL